MRILPAGFVRASAILLFATAPIAFNACSSDSATSTTSVATTISVSSGNAQSAVAGTSAASALTVKVVDQNGAAMSGVAVTFVITSGGGTLSAATATTNTDGLAAVTYTAGTTAGTATITATVAGLTAATFTTTVSARTATTLTASSGGGQTIVSGVAAATSLAVKVVDQTGAALSGATVTWAITAGGGALGPPTSTTDANGAASTTYTAGTTAGTATITATVAGVTAVTFTETIAARAATTLSISSGGGQTVAAGASTANPLVAKVVDQTGAALSGVTVTFSVTSGGGAVGTTSATTNATGLASTTYTAGATAGTSVVTASVSGLTAVTFSTTIAAVGSNVLSKVSGDAQTAAINAALANPFTVKVVDPSSNIVTGLTVNWAITAGGGTLSSATSMTNASGLATVTYTAGTTTGTSTVTASIAGGSSVAFTATVIAGTSNSCASQSTNAATVVCLANAFLATLTTAQQASVTPALTKANAIRWSNLPCGLTCRNGLLFSSLTSAQLSAALAVPQSALSTAGYTTFDQIRKADTYLNANGGGNGYGEGIYIIAFLGTPSTTAPWMLQLGGHHHAANIYFNAGATSTSITPNFVGVEPQSFTLNGVTYAPLDSRKNGMYNMIQSLTTAQLATAKLSSSFDDVLLGPNQDGKFPAQQGILVSTLTTAQQTLVTTAIQAWINDAPSELAATLLADYTSTGAYANTYVAWTGATTPTVQGSYVRIDGPHVWLEFVCQNGVVFRSQIHFHTIWRDKVRDYGGSFTF